MTEYARAALELAAAAWSVIPLNCKLPLTSHGVHDAATDPDVIREWWARWPGANIGAAVPDLLLVLDVDPRNGGDVNTLGDLPPTLTVWSGRHDGGCHLYFLRPPGPLTGVRLPAGIDLKLNGYCVMPPSIHPSTGRAYWWEKHPPAVLPAELRRLLRPLPAPKRVRGSGGDGKGLVAFVARQGEGNRNNALYWAARRAVEEDALDALADDLVAAATSAGESETAARRTVDSARKAM